MSNLSTSDFKLAKSVFLVKSDLSTPVVFFKSAFDALDDFGLQNIYPFMLCLLINIAIK